MKIRIEKTGLLKCLERVKEVCDPKSAMPILSKVHLRADPDTLLGCLVVSATDLFQGITVTINCAVDEEGSICVSGRELYDRLKLMPDGDVSIYIKDNNLVVKAAKSARKFTLSTVDAAEYPTLDSLPEVDPLVVNDIEFSQKISAAIYAVSTDNTRNVLNSLCFETNMKDVGFAATDGHRLAVLMNSNIGNNPTQFLVPLNAAKELLKLCNESGKNKGDWHDVLVYNNGPTLFFNIAGYTYYCKLADGNFPPYRQIMPTEWKHEIKVNCKTLSETFKSLAVSTGQSRGVKVEIHNNKLVIIAESESGSGSDEVECSYEFTGKDTPTYGVSAPYMVDALSQINTENCVIKLNQELDPILIEEDCDNERTEQYVAVVMPIRI